MLFAWLKEENLRTHLIKDAAGTFWLRIVGTGLMFLASVILARLLGASGYGAYAYAMAWIMVLGIPASLGTGELLVRELAIYRSSMEWGMLKGILQWASRAVILASLGIAIVAASVAWLLSEALTPVIITFLLALLLLPINTLSGVRLAAMRGLNRIVIGQIPILVVRPVLFIVLLGSAYLLLGHAITPTGAVGLYIIGVLVALWVSGRLLNHYMPSDAVKAQAVFQPRTWFNSMIPFIVISGMYVVNNRADVIMLGAMSGVQSAGVYAVASTGAELVIFVLATVNLVIAPTVASLYKTGDRKRLQQVVTKSARLVLLATLPLALALIMFGHWFLLVFFGAEFTEGATALALLSLGQLINAAMGSVGLLLNMTGYERKTAIGVGLAAVLNIILNALLIPLWGLNGAAIATFTSLVAWNVLLFIQVYKNLRINPTALGKIRQSVG